MDFWSKGLGKRTVRLYLRDGTAAKSGERLFVSGRMAEPMSWDYIMPLEAADFAEFMALLREPQVASFLYHSPRRNSIYRTLVIDGLRLVTRLAMAMLRHALGRDESVAEPTIQVPPPRERKPRTPGGRSQRESRRRLNRPRPAAGGADAAGPEPTDTDVATPGDARATATAAEG